MKRLLCSVLALVLLLSCALAEQRVFMKGETDDFSPDEQLLELFVCPLAGADAMILRCGGEVMAVDVGKLNHNVEVMQLLNDIGESHLSMIFNTHPHDDHCGGMLNLVHDDVTIDKYVTAFPLEHNMKGSVQNLILKTVREAGIPIEQVADGDVFWLGSAKFTCLQHVFNSGNINNSSCMLLVEYGETKLLLTGDIDTQAELMLIEDHPELGKVDVMKAPHHGLAELRAPYMNAVDPEFVFITNGSGTSEPGRKMLDRRGIPYLYASRGPISIVSNGSKWIVTQDLFERFR